MSPRRTSIDNLSVNDSVIVRPKCENGNKRYEGTIRVITYDYVNRGNKDWGQEKCVYVNFININDYHDILLQGWHIYCNIRGKVKQCYIARIEKNNNRITQLQVAEYDKEHHYLDPVLYTIRVDDVDSILITDKSYDYAKL